MIRGERAGSQTYLVLLGAAEQMSEGLFHVSSKAGSEDVLLGPELVARLPNNRIDHIQPGDFVFRFALEDELLDVLHDVLVELYGFHRSLGDTAHFRLRDGNFEVGDRKELKYERDHIKITSNWALVGRRRIPSLSTCSLRLITRQSLQFQPSDSSPELFTFQRVFYLVREVMYGFHLWIHLGVRFVLFVDFFLPYFLTLACF